MIENSFLPIGYWNIVRSKKTQNSFPWEKVRFIYLRKNDDRSFLDKRHYKESRWLLTLRWLLTTLRAIHGLSVQCTTSVALTCYTPCLKFSKYLNSESTNREVKLKTQNPNPYSITTLRNYSLLSKKMLLDIEVITIENFFISKPSSNENKWSYLWRGLSFAIPFLPLWIHNIVDIFVLKIHNVPQSCQTHRSSSIPYMCLQGTKLKHNGNHKGILQKEQCSLLSCLHWAQTTHFSKHLWAGFTLPPL